MPGRRVLAFTGIGRWKYLVAYSARGLQTAAAADRGMDADGFLKRLIAKHTALPNYENLLSLQ